MPKKVLLAPPENIMVQAENLVKIYKSRDVEVMALHAAIKMTKHLTMNVAYFWTNYKDYNKMTETALGASSTTYSRTNKVFGLGVDYKF